MKIIAIGLLADNSALLLSASGVSQLPAISKPTVAPGYADRLGMMGGGGVVSGSGMTQAPARSAGVGGGIMGRYGYSSSEPTAVPTPVAQRPFQ